MSTTDPAPYKGKPVCRCRGVIATIFVCRGDRDIAVHAAAASELAMARCPLPILVRP
jgi:hypothetical protein